MDRSSSNLSVEDNIDSGLTYNSQYHLNKTYKKFINFIKEYAITNRDDVKKRESSNVIDMGKKIAYAIPTDLLPVFFGLLEACRKENLIINFAEKQCNESGLMLDFDILQANEQSQLTDNHFIMISRMVTEIISDMISDIDRYNSYVMILKKQNTEFKPEHKCFKDGFHMIMPSIKLTKSVKKLIVQQILDTGVLSTVFEDVKFNGEINTILDTHSVSVPTLYPGNCKVRKSPYLIHSIYKINVVKNRVVNMTTMNDNEINSLNIVYDFSVNYARENSIVTKVIANIKPNILSSIIVDIPIVNNVYDDDLSILTVHDPDSLQLQRILDILKPFRVNEYKYWLSIVCALAYTNARYKPLAYKFSEKREVKGVRSSFEKVWETAISNPGRYAYTKDMIYNYARADNLEEYTKIIQDGVLTMLLNYIYDPCINGNLDHWHFAQLLKKMVGTKYRTDDSSTKSGTQWYEFILEDDKREPGEIYKWKESDSPHTLRDYISVKLPLLFTRALLILTERKNNSDDPDVVKYCNSLTKSIKSSYRKLFNNGVKNLIMKEAESAFRETYMSRHLDKDPDILGVCNGVLVLSNPPELITTRHDYKISRYTTVEYKPIDINSTLCKEVFKSIWDLFPENESDAFTYTMFHLSTCLSGRPKSCQLYIMTGGGANGKSYLLELIKNIMGNATDKGYGAKIPVSFLSERSQPSNNASPVLEPLRYARFAYFSESELSMAFNMQILKELLSHEAISFRALYSKQENITHNCTFMLGTNYPPCIKTTDHGSWRRILYYVFKIKLCNNPDPNNVYEKKADPSFTAYKTKNPEFLSAALSIFLMYLSVLNMEYDGDITKVPNKTIEAQTEEYRNSQDVVNRFITERLVVTPDEKTEMLLTDLVDHYCRWYDTNVKEQKHERHDIANMFINSRLSKSFIKKNTGVSLIKGHRVLGSAEEKNEDEEYLIQSSNVRNRLDIEYKSSDEALSDIYERYQNGLNKLSKLNN